MGVEFIVDVERKRNSSRKSVYLKATSDGVKFVVFTIKESKKNFLLFKKRKSSGEENLFFHSIRKLFIRV